jgi:hypothetical protein
MSTVSIFGAAAVLRASWVDAFGAIVDDGEVVLGVVVVAG